MMTPQEIYTQHLLKLNAQQAILNKRKLVFGWLRLLIMGFVFVSLWWMWTSAGFIALPLPVLFLGLFLFVLSKDLNNNDAIENLERLAAITETEIEVLNHRFQHLPEGNEYKPETHDYAKDMDIFGRASLFQYINRCTTEQGNKLLAEWLLKPSNAEAIIQKQKAVKELAPQLEWRQQLQSFGKSQRISIATERKIEQWVHQPAVFISNRYWQLLRFLLPSISFVFLGLHLAGIMEASFFYPLIAMMLTVSFGISKRVMPFYLQLDKIAPQLESLSAGIRWIEKADFKTELLITLKNKYTDGRIPTSQSVKNLKKILDRLDIRLNPLVFLPLNTFLFWDLQQVFALEKWKKRNEEHIGDWFQALAEIESLSSLGNLSFNHPHWVFPAITSQPGVFLAESLGHPLIPADKLVSNSFATEGTGRLNLITGSNMAGKSTFLRAVGVNTVLAMMGAPVCASALTVSHTKLMSSMRVSDNLEENTSTFYAELKKLKEVIEEVYKNQSVFLLLDEILRGTNSADRQAGSKALIKQLIHHNAAGLIATHDLELAKLADTFPGKIHNYHFDVQVADDELYFDYKLKKGVCQSMNASLLMKKIGIEL
jgi:hypothetical protein